MANHNGNGHKDDGARGNTDRGGMGQSGYGAGNGDVRWQQDQDAMQRSRGGEGRWQGDRNVDNQRSEYGSRGLQVGQHPYDQDQGSGDNQGSYSQGSFGRYQGSPGSQGGYSEGSDGATFGGSGSHGLSFPSHRHRAQGAGPMQPGPHKGKGPKNWQRSDEKLRDMASEALHDDEHIDATHIELQVKDGEATLTGTVPDRSTKRMAEDCVERVTGIKDVHNQLKIQSDGAMAKGQGNSGASYGSGSDAKDDKKPRA